MRYVLPVVLALTCLAHPQPRSLPPELVRLQRQQGDLSYGGVRRVTLGRRSYLERVIIAGRRMRAEFPPGSPGAGQIIVDDSRRRMHYIPAENVIRVMPSRPDFLLPPPRPGAPAMRVRTRAGGKIAGLDTELYEVSMGDEVVHRIWAEARRGAILKRELFGRGGRRLSAFEFLEFAYSPRITDSTFSIQKPNARVVDIAAELRRAARELGIRPMRLHEGTGYDLHAVRSLEQGSAKALMQVYEGPGGRVSLFQIRGQIDPNRLRSLAGERAQVYTWKRGEYTFALLGALESEDLRGLADALTDK